MAEAKEIIALDPKDPDYQQKRESMQALARNIGAQSNPKLAAFDWGALVVQVVPLLVKVLKAYLTHQEQQTEAAKQTAQKMSDIAYDIRRHTQIERNARGMK